MNAPLSVTAARQQLEALEITVARRQHRLEQSRAAYADAQRALEIAEAAQLPTRDGSVIVFSLVFAPAGSRTYDYAARLVAGRWYTTGSSCPPRGYTPRELVELIRGAYARTQIDVLEGVSRVVEL